jgi:hypothetical protein
MVLIALQGKGGQEKCYTMALSLFPILQSLSILITFCILRGLKLKPPMETSDVSSHKFKNPFEYLM